MEATLDLVIRNARIVDGLGGPARQGDVGVSGDRIVQVGTVDRKAAREIDAGGKVVAPGFIDIHTHYDPQLCWDGMASPSPEHGVTTIVAGNCSLSLAPVKPSGRQKISNLFGVVEDLDGQYMASAVPFSWESFEEYLSHIRKVGFGPNVGIFVGHSALRLFVMGAAAQERAATDEEIEQMVTLLREGVRRGGLGLSLTFGHIDENGEELPCAFADDRELRALYDALAEERRGLVECAPNIRDAQEVLDIIDRLGSLSKETGVTTSFSPVLQVPSRSDSWMREMSRIHTWQQRGAPIHGQTQVRPLDMALRLSRGSAALTKLVKWSKIMGLTVPERIKAFSDRSIWPELDAEISTMAFFDAVTVGQSELPENQKYRGRHIREIANTEGRSYVEVMLGLALPEKLETEFEIVNYTHADADIVSLMLTHPSLMIGSADAGAHVGQFAGAGDTTYLLQHYVRKLGRITLEKAVQRITSDLAKAWQITDRGEISEGKFADLVIFDPDTVERGEQQWVADLPGGGGRFIRHATGIDAVIVNGKVIVEGGSYTDARPGVLI